ncbi:RNA polymerase sigma factor [Salibacterium aidingense]|uniref:RNA polymerase sigma factor n=1 Tax=Salibacterium aidingense TaxID=384933 RepID=UPI0004078868|nr:sigma-70 family RNA polymerase sigma factor [Salibacterium aidingense]
MSDEFQQTWEHYLPSTWKTCMYLAKNKHDAEDLLQTTWEKAFRSWRKQQQAELTKSYFSIIAKNTWIDKKRKKQVPTVSVDNAGEISGSIFHESNVDLEDLLRPLVKKLSLNQQVVFLLAEVCCCSLKEIAMLTKLSTGAVKSNLFRARHTVRTKVRAGAAEKENLKNEEALRVSLYANALQDGDIQTIAGLLTEEASVYTLYSRRSLVKSSELRLAA